MSTVMATLPTNISNPLHLIKKEECYYYHKLVLSKANQFNFLAEDEAPVIVDDEVKLVRMYRKRANKNTKGAAQIKQKKQKANRK
ncbi:hypothetical protein H5410_015343 [Solanum commersonii]|uniref:Uncharacterized protein n=1 Tax=Solanum commersonii TaxID=4109 RepID=A0A9J5ZU67_SOLCO|nr:hypothetical protein H5410_015343 [Solanum commersonii]